MWNRILPVWITPEKKDRRARKKQHKIMLVVELLESRTVLAFFPTVTTTVILRGGSFGLPDQIIRSKQNPGFVTGTRSYGGTVTGTASGSASGGMNSLVVHARSETNVTAGGGTIPLLGVESNVNITGYFILDRASVVTVSGYASAIGDYLQGGVRGRIGSPDASGFTFSEDAVDQTGIVISKTLVLSSGDFVFDFDTWFYDYAGRTPTISTASLDLSITVSPVGLPTDINLEEAVLGDDAGSIGATYTVSGSINDFYASLYRSGDTTLDVSDGSPLVTQRVTVPPSKHGTEVFDISGGLAGLRVFDHDHPYAIIKLDSFDEINESNETNNTFAVRVWEPPFTILTHGFQPFPSDGIPDWTKDAFINLTNTGVNNKLVTDWLEESNNPSPGWAEAAGDALFARMMWEAQHRQRSFDVHYIGHSRGTVVNSEANERLAYYESVLPQLHSKIGDVQVTMLDAHPANNTPGYSGSFVSGNTVTISSLFDAGFESLANDPDPFIWNNVEWADAYYQNSNATLLMPGLEKILNLWGYGTNAPYNSEVYLNKNLTGDRLNTGDRIGHSEVPLWYAESILQTDDSPEGFFYSLAGDGWNERPGATIRRPTRIPSIPDTVFNGDFRFGTHLLGDEIPGWSYSDGPSIAITKANALRFITLGTGYLEHDAMFVPPGVNELHFDVRNSLRGSTGQLIAYFIPAVLDSSSQLAHSGQSIEIGRWPIASLPSSNSLNAELSARIPIPTGSLGATGYLRFVVTPAGNASRSILDFDNVRLQGNGSQAVAAQNVTLLANTNTLANSFGPDPNAIAFIPPLSPTTIYDFVPFVLNYVRKSKRVVNLQTKNLG